MQKVEKEKLCTKGNRAFKMMRQSEGGPFEELPHFPIKCVSLQVEKWQQHALWRLGENMGHYRRGITPSYVYTRTSMLVPFTKFVTKL